MATIIETKVILTTETGRVTFEHESDDDGFYINVNEEKPGDGVYVTAKQVTYARDVMANAISRTKDSEMNP